MTSQLARALLAGLVAAATAAGTGAQSTAASAPVFPGAEWERIARPESVGWSATGLDSVRAKLAKLLTTAFMAIVGGRVLMQYGDVQRVSYLASARKSVLSMLYGIYHDRGKIDLNKTLAQLGIDDVGGLTAQEKEATALDLIRARSGVYHAASNPGDNLASAPPRGSQKHGAYFLYSNWDFNALGTIFERQTGVDIYDALQRDLAEPLGMRDFNRATQQKMGDLSLSVHPAYHMWLSTRDMARLGYLMLRRGNWNGRQIISESWVRESTRTQTPRVEMNPASVRNGVFGYGYLWWVFDKPNMPPDIAGAYTALGAFGQMILVVPNLDLVVVHKTAPESGDVSEVQFFDVVESLLGARTKRIP
ncbi:MAG TPA: serine hydrolase [Gemmatimonadaceae bacterium]|nr:serine hydrolase [Gemmatimonadaceae bacterium]